MGQSKRDSDFMEDTPCRLVPACTVVRPAKAGVFSRRQTCRGNSQKPRSLDRRVAGNQDSEADRQPFPWGMGESSGRNENERGSGLENARSEGRARNREGEGSMSSRTLTDTAISLRRGGSDGTMARTCQATGETLLAPARNRRSKVGPITGEPGKWAEGEREAEGSVLAMKPGNAGGVKGPCCNAMTSTTWEARTR